MRILYFLTKYLFQYSLRIFYPRIKLVNSPKKYFNRTIYVSNHPASFMDPLTFGSLSNPIVFFLTRSDVFTTFAKPFLWASQMLPIYRQRDGEDTKGKNEVVFQKCSRILSFGRSLLLFGEGFTDDKFIRRLKPVKKGAIRIGFTSLERINWSKKIHIVAVGLNYSEPNLMRSDLLISFSNSICLNDYKKEFEENPSKIITELTKKLELLMQSQITHVENKDLAPFHEQIMIFTRKGMNPRSFDRKYTLRERWQYSQGLAHWLNNQNLESNNNLMSLQKELADYFEILEQHKIKAHHVHWKSSSQQANRSPEILNMLLLFPLGFIGFLQCSIPYLITKRFVEKTFKRKVFWGSVKFIMGQIAVALLAIPQVFLFYYFVYPSWWLAIAYFFSIGLTGLAAYEWVRNYKAFIAKGAILSTDVTNILSKKRDLENKINETVPESFSKLSNE